MQSCLLPARDVRGDCGSLTFVLLFQDETYTVTVYKRVLQNGSRCWEHFAELCSHYKPIRSILFGVQLDSNKPRLLSLGEDRHLVGQCESLKGFVVKVWNSAFNAAAPNPLPTSSVTRSCFSDGCRADLPRVQAEALLLQGACPGCCRRC